MNTKQQQQIKYKELGYFKSYYQNVTKNQKYYCVCCDHEFNVSHKARHFKTQKHQLNENIRNLKNLPINDVYIWDLDNELNLNS